MDEYNLDKFIKKITGLEYIEVYKIVLAEVVRIDAIYDRVKAVQTDYKFNYYRDHVGDFLFFLNVRTVIPKGIGKEGLRLFAPVIEHIVQTGGLTDESLKLLQ